MSNINTVQAFDKVQSKPATKNQRVSSKEGIGFKDTLDQTIKDSQKPVEKQNLSETKDSQTKLPEKEKVENVDSKDTENTKKEEIKTDDVKIDQNNVANTISDNLKLNLTILNKPSDLTSNLESGKISSESMPALEQISVDKINLDNKQSKADGKIKLEGFKDESLDNEEIISKKDIKFESNSNKPAEEEGTKIESHLKVDKKETLELSVHEEDKTKLDENNEVEFSEVYVPNKHEAIPKTEVIKVKVGDGQTISSEKLVDEVAKNIIIKSEDNKQYELQLDPENLGKIKVKLLFEDGKLTVSLLCNNNKTAAMLSEGISNLGQAIQQTTKSEVTVNVQEENYLNNNQNNNEKGNNPNSQNQNRQNKQNDSNFEDQMKMGLWEIENLKRQFATDFKFI